MMRKCLVLLALIGALFLAGRAAVAADLENTLYLDLPAGRVVIQDRKSVV